MFEMNGKEIEREIVSLGDCRICILSFVCLKKLIMEIVSGKLSHSFMGK
jgi:hypothetical protein